MWYDGVLMRTLLVYVQHNILQESLVCQSPMNHRPVLRRLSQRIAKKTK